MLNCSVQSVARVFQLLRLLKVIFVCVSVFVFEFVFVVVVVFVP